MNLNHTTRGAEIYLIRNELDYWLFSPQKMVVDSAQITCSSSMTLKWKMYYQCNWGPKGSHLLRKWMNGKDVLSGLDAESQIILIQNKMILKTMLSS